MVLAELQACHRRCFGCRGRVPAAACPHAQRWAVISEAGPARVPIPASAPPPSLALPGGARSQVCPSQVCPSQVCRIRKPPAPFCLQNTFGLGAMLTPPVPGSSWDVLEAEMAPLPLLGCS